MNHLWKTSPSHLLLVQVGFIYSSCVLLLRIHYPSLQCALNYSTSSYSEGPGQHNLHSNLPLVGRSGNWIPVKARFYAPVQTPLGPAQPPVRQAKQPGCGADCPLRSSAEVKGSIQQSLYPLSQPSWPVLWSTLPFTFIIAYWNISMICSRWRTRLLMLMSMMAGGEGPSSPNAPRPYRQALCTPLKVISSLIHL
jgi:hypothetical protein